MYESGERIRLGLLCLLLLLALGMLAFTFAGTYQAVRIFQQRNGELATGDVSTICSWMTIHAISHIYQVPEGYLENALQIGSPAQVRHTTLNQLARHKRQPVDQLIRSIQHAITAYRKNHPHHGTPMPVPKPTVHATLKPHRVSLPVTSILLSANRSHSAMSGRTSK